MQNITDTPRAQMAEVEWGLASQSPSASVPQRSFGQETSHVRSVLARLQGAVVPFAVLAGLAAPAGEVRRQYTIHSRTPVAWLSEFPGEDAWFYFPEPVSPEDIAALEAILSLPSAREPEFDFRDYD